MPLSPPRHESIEAFRNALASGLVEKVDEFIANYLFLHPPTSPLHVAELAIQHRVTRNQRSVTPRFAPLVRDGTLYEFPEKQICPVSGETVNFYTHAIHAPPGYVPPPVEEKTNISDQALIRGVDSLTHLLSTVQFQEGMPPMQFSEDLERLCTWLVRKKNEAIRRRQ